MASLMAALATLHVAERLAQQLVGPHHLLAPTRGEIVRTLVLVGATERAEQALAVLAEPDCERGEIRVATAALRLAQGDPHAATTVLAPVLDGPDPIILWTWLVDAYLLEATARDILGNPDAAANALERALDIAEPYRAVMPFVLPATPPLLERHARHHTAHASLVAEIRNWIAGPTPTTSTAGPHMPVEPLSDSELRILRYLPTNLRAREIARQLYVSPNTVKTHTPQPVRQARHPWAGRGRRVRPRPRSTRPFWNRSDESGQARGVLNRSNEAERPPGAPSNSPGLIRPSQRRGFIRSLDEWVWRGLSGHGDRDKTV